MTKFGGNVHVPVISRNYITAIYSYEICAISNFNWSLSNKDVENRRPDNTKRKGIFLMIAIRIIQWIARIAWLGALTLGLLFWITGIDLISLHMLFGLTLGLSLLILGIVLVSTRGVRFLGLAGIVYAFILPIFGLTQTRLLVNDMHWLIQAAHLLVGIGAIALVEIMRTRYDRLKIGDTGDVPSQATALQTRK